MSRFDGIKSLILAGVLVTGLWGCGSASYSDSTTTVRVTLQVPGSSLGGPAPLQSVPVGVASIRLVVTGEGMDALIDTFDVTPGEIVTRNLEVPSGSGRVFTVTAYSSIGIALYRGQSDPVDLEPGLPIAVAINMEVLLVSIEVTPLNLSVGLGALQPFTATGTCGDNTTQDLTTQVTWSSSATGIATISNALGSEGLATSVAVGSTTITATLGSISGSTTLSVTPVLNRLSLVSGIIGDTLKMTGDGFGSTQGTGTVSIGGVNAATILRWGDTEIAAIIPSGVTVSSTGTSNSVLATVGGQPSNLMSVTLFDHTHGVGGELDDGNLDKLVLAVATSSVTVTDLPLSGFTDFGETSSIVLSGDGNTAAEADDFTYAERIRNFDTTSPLLDEPSSLPNFLDVAISRNGTTVLLADGTNTLTRHTNFTAGTPTVTSFTIPSGDCIYEVALTSDRNTAAAIAQENPDGCIGAFNVYRINNVLGTPTFTLISTAGSGASYTDVAISEDGKTVIAGLITGNTDAGVHRIIDFTTAPSLIVAQAGMITGCDSVNTVDVDLSADGMTGIAGVAGCSISASTFHYVFQIRNADAASATVAQVSTPVSVEGVAVHSGGSIALVRVADNLGIALIRFDGFNLASPTATDLMSSGLPDLNTSLPFRNQDQIDLQ